MPSFLAHKTFLDLYSIPGLQYSPKQVNKIGKQKTKHEKEKKNIWK